MKWTVTDCSNYDRGTEFFDKSRTVPMDYPTTKAIQWTGCCSLDRHFQTWLFMFKSLNKRTHMESKYLLQLTSKKQTTY